LPNKRSGLTTKSFRQATTKKDNGSIALAKTSRAAGVADRRSATVKKIRRSGTVPTAK
jgi:hypothetical protein